MLFGWATPCTKRSWPLITWFPCFAVKSNLLFTVRLLVMSNRPSVLPFKHLNRRAKTLRLLSLSSFRRKIFTIFSTLEWCGDLYLSPRLPLFPCEQSKKLSVLDNPSDVRLNADHSDTQPHTVPCVWPLCQHIMLMVEYRPLRHSERMFSSIFFSAPMTFLH